MPLWQIFHYPGAFTPEDKQSLSQAITNNYTGRHGLPEFYTVVIFESSDSIYVGGKSNENFVRIVISHLARESNVMDEKAARATQTGFDAILKPYVGDRGMTWEYHYDNSPRLFWRVNGLIPPPAGSAEEMRWRKENRPIPYY